MADKKAAAALPPVSPATPAAMPSASPVAASPAAPPPVPAKTLLPATIKQQYMPPVDLPLHYHLSIFSAMGLTPYFGMLDIG